MLFPVRFSKILSFCRILYVALYQKIFIFRKTPENGRKKPAEAGFGYYIGRCLGARNIGSLFSLGTLSNIKRNLLPFFEGFESVHADCQEMGEEIFVTIIRGDETKAFGVIETFYCTCCHMLHP